MEDELKRGDNEGRGEEETTGDNGILTYGVN